MKQYRITSADFVLQGETGDADTVMNPDDLAQIRRLAGLITEDGGALSGIAATPRAEEGGIASPVGSNITDTARYRNELLEKYGARPGDGLWFLINFEPVRGLGAASGTLEEKITEYLKKYPKERPKN